MAGRSTLVMKAAELGLDLDGEVIGRVLDELKRLEHEGYHFEVADGSLELLLRRAAGWTATTSPWSRSGSSPITAETMRSPAGQWAVVPRRA